MNDSLFLSRSFVEFGPFEASEMLSFYKRGLLKDSDYVRSETSDAWVHVNEWADSAAPAAAPQSVPAEPPAPKAEKEVIPTPPTKEAPAAKKAAPAKKAAAKKAKKSA